MSGQTGPRRGWTRYNPVIAVSTGSVTMIGLLLMGFVFMMLSADAVIASAMIVFDGLDFFQPIRDSIAQFFTI
jgi:hypothetical protein